MIGNTADRLYSAREIAKILDLTPERVKKQVAEGVIPRIKRGKYAPSRCIHAYARDLRRAIARFSGKTRGNPSDKPKQKKMPSDQQTVGRSTLGRIERGDSSEYDDATEQEERYGKTYKTTEGLKG